MILSETKCYYQYNSDCLTDVEVSTLQTRRRRVWRLWTGSADGPPDQGRAWGALSSLSGESSSDNIL